MASKEKSKSKKFGSTKSKAANYSSYSTTSSSKPYLDTSIDGQSSPASSSVRSKPHFYSETLPLDAGRSKENVTVTVRFRPLSPREIHQGEEIAWYADGETIVRNEHNPSIAYAYDRVFGPTTTTRNVYDVAAQHAVSGAMEGISGTIFAYGVTSSGKTHTMHGDQRSPGIIPLAVKDAFSIIQETPNREFLLRMSYLEIYNEVMNDLLNPAGQNLRIREDSQGIFVEGIKEEVVLSPAHALSLIAAGEEHRHVGSTNFNLLSSRSHTIFTLTIESSPCGENSQGEAVSLSQLNLIDLAGSESSKAETTGVRRKEGSYINKSLLTLGTVISKLTDGRAAHIPYRDSKLTRLLQSSLSGHGRVSLICTVTPSSSSSEETHNTLKFAHRAKHIEIQAAQNKIIDEKSLIKKYQNEIRSLKEELEQLRRGIVRVPQLKDSAEEDLLLLKRKLEDGQVKLQSRLEQEEEAKATLLARIQRLTKLILVSSKASQSSRVLPHRPGHRSRHSFGEEELSYLPHKRPDLILDNDNIELYGSPEGNAETTNAMLKEKKTRKHGLLNWLKPRKRESGLGTLTSTGDKSSGIKSMSTPSTTQGESSILHTEARLSHSLLSESSPSAELLSEAREDREVHGDNFRGQETPLSVSELMAQLNEKSFELEVKAADNRVIQEQLNQKISECGGLQNTIASLKQQLSDALELSNLNTAITYSQRFTETGSSHGEDGSGRGLLLGAQATAIEELKQTVGELTESKEQLELRNQKLAEESSYAKGLASAAAIELKALSEEIAKLMNHNERLAAELAASKNSPTQRRTSPAVRNGRRDSHVKRNDQGGPVSDIKRELAASREKELSYEAALLEKDQREAQLQRRVEESKQREAYLENELANMWVLVAKLKKSHGAETEASESTRQTPRVEGFGI
ncbi:kinesin-like protein KIN-7K, chloroplastic isoform X2 [Carya illinoinensis]|uniref:Kinesin-like protein n=1 Tax=Carya illinoinensis TaxID=32201 RepID=A0A8T1P6P0_CARIL|nr:kinesin-like protein KIN-7K, chloroplastic isoform X2 [Carya illinoinensis]KAG6638285.1 hypothetical protein CIPAW_10G025000 [Carya illinoinensis]KAG6690637.1 hypothetical protein I3842_10G024500 [Carya illinoinensis]